MQNEREMQMIERMKNDSNKVLVLDLLNADDGQKDFRFSGFAHSRLFR